jgi:hypothetical protein
VNTLFDEFDQPLEHLGLAGEVAVQGRFAHVQPSRQGRRSDALGARLLQHRRQRLKNLDAPLARLGALACRSSGLFRGRRIGAAELRVGHGFKM